MTKAEVIKTIKIVARTNGFETRDVEYGTLGVTIESENLNFFIMEHIDIDKMLKTKVATHEMYFKASVSRMGGETSTEELYAISDEIKRGAVVVDTLNTFELVWDEELERK